jgi:hypothetical protein
MACHYPEDVTILKPKPVNGFRDPRLKLHEQPGAGVLTEGEAMEVESRKKGAYNHPV